MSVRYQDKIDIFQRRQLFFAFFEDRISQPPDRLTARCRLE